MSLYPPVALPSKPERKELSKFDRQFPEFYGTQNNFLSTSPTLYLWSDPSITDGVHRIENLVEIIPVFSTFSKFLKKKKKKL